MVARELTKLHEEFVRGTLPELAAQFREKSVRGEITLLIGPRIKVPWQKHMRPAARLRFRNALRKSCVSKVWIEKPPLSKRRGNWV